MQTLQDLHCHGLQSRGRGRWVARGDWHYSGTHKQLWESRGGLGRGGRIRRDFLEEVMLKLRPKGQAGQMGQLSQLNTVPEHRLRVLGVSFPHPTLPTAAPDKHTQNRHQGNVKITPAYCAPTHRLETLSGHVQQNFP